MKTYIIRAVKYFLTLIILMFVLFAFMYLTGTSASNDYLGTLSSQRGIFMFISLMALAAVYPYFGYGKRVLNINYESNKDQIINVMSMCGYKFSHLTEQGELVFRASATIKKITTMGEDAITIKDMGESLSIDGIRKELVRIEYRLKTFVKKD